MANSVVIITVKGKQVSMVYFLDVKDIKSVVCDMNTVNVNFTDEESITIDLTRESVVFELKD